MCSLYSGGGATLLVVTWQRENRNTLIERKAFVNTVGIKGADLEDEFLLLIFAVFRERPQITVCCLTRDASKAISRLSLTTPNNTWRSAAFPYIKVPRKENLEQKIHLQIGFLYLNESVPVPE